MRILIINCFRLIPFSFKLHQPIVVLYIIWIMCNFIFFFNLQVLISKGCSFHCVKSTQVRNFSCTVFFLNRIEYGGLRAMSHKFPHSHCMKSVQIRSFFCSKYRKIKTRKKPIFGHFSCSVSPNTENSKTEKTPYLNISYAVLVGEQVTLTFWFVFCEGVWLEISIWKLWMTLQCCCWYIDIIFP